jgi:hypothetical protein
MNTVQNKLESLHLSIWINQAHQKQSSIKSIKNRKLNLLAPLRQWLNNIEVKDSAFAHRVCQLIPSQCPFEREIKLFGRTIANPLYNEVIALRFRAICYLADVCGEDVSVYC